MHNFLNMGGYGWYVWPAYLITLSVFGINVTVSLLEKKRVRQVVKNYHE